MKSLYDINTILVSSKKKNVKTNSPRNLLSRQLILQLLTMLFGELT